MKPFLALLALLLTLLGPPARADLSGPEGRTSAGSHAGAEPALLPLPRPASVAGELSTPRFRILYTAHAEGAARALATEIEGVRDAFGTVLGRDWPGRTELRVGVGREEFESLALPGGSPPGWAAALAYPAHQIILLDARTLRAEGGNTTLRHELAHVALGQLGPEWPRWFQEGLAMNLSGERLSVSQYAALFRAVRQERVLHFSDLERGWPEQPWDVEIAYAQSAAFVAHLTSRYGPQRMAELVDAVGRGSSFEAAFARAFLVTLRLEEDAWRDALPARYGWLPLATTEELLWLLAAALCLAAFLLRQRQKTRHLAQLEAEDVAEARLEAEAEAALRLSTAAVPPEATPPTDGLLTAWDEHATVEEPAPPPEPGTPAKPTLH